MLVRCGKGAEDPAVIPDHDAAAIAGELQESQAEGNGGFD